MSTKSKWDQVISSKLKEGQSLADLKTTYDSSIVMEPNIVAEEVAGLQHTIADLKPWVNMATIKGTNAGELNSLALLALNHGANGLNLIPEKPILIKDALSGVLTEYLDVRIDCSTWALDDIIAEKKRLDHTAFPNVRWIGKGQVTEIQISATDRVTQYKAVLSELTSDQTYDIVITVSKNLLFEIASLRALRIVLNRLGITDYNLLVRYDVEGTNSLGDYDLIEKTYKVMSGIMGCADSVLTAYDGSEDARLSLNIHNVLELESGFKDVMDPVGGAYYVEKLVGEIIESVTS